MCCSNNCEWERPDNVEGGTTCVKPIGAQCPEDVVAEGEDSEEDW